MITRTPWVVLPLLLVLAPACKRDGAGSTSAASGGDGGTMGAATTGTVPGTDTNGAAGAGGPSFEGTITMHMTDPRTAPHDITMITKGSKIRVDIPEKNGTSAHSIFDPSTGKALVIMDAQKMAMTMTIPAGTATPQGGPPKVTRTGKHETIAGRDCEDWDIVQPVSGKHEQACITEGMNFFDFTSMSAGGARGSTSPWLEELRDKHEFPLRAITLDPSGKETSRMEVTKLEAKPVDDSMFTVPAGYKEMDMSKLSGLAGALGGKGLPQGLPH